MVSHGANALDPESRRQQPQAAAKRSPGRPRSEQARRAILRSTLRLLKHTGFSDLTIEAIAADAEVGKATVYRWWPNKGALVVDAFASSADRKLRFPDTGSVQRDISMQMNKLSRFFAVHVDTSWPLYSAPDNPTRNCLRHFVPGSYGRADKKLTVRCAEESSAVNCLATLISI